MKPKIKMTIYGDGIHDDTEAIKAYNEGRAELFYPDGTPFSNDWKYSPQGKGEDTIWYIPLPEGQSPDEPVNIKKKQKSLIGRLKEWIGIKPSPTSL